jgi:EAL domain-containing protein (putative c-di-GMP-specific phosphodiesterase class I)
MKQGATAQPVTSVLLVDDERAVLKMTMKALTRRGYRVVGCGSGDEALRCLGRETFDCMVSDVRMPGIDGVRLLRAVRDRDLDIPVVLMTGSPEVGTAAAAVEYGAFQYLIKPVENDQLDETVARAANAGRMARLKRAYVEHHGSGVFPVGDKAGLDAMLDRALASLWMAYQPVVLAADGSTFAQEALLRSEEASLPDPGAVLEVAQQADRLHDVGRLVRAAVRQAVDAADDWLFFVNLHPSDLHDPELYEADAPLSGIAKRVVLEITERASLDALPDLSERIERLREMGFRIALDDLGAGYAGLTSFVRLEPEFVKLDTSLIRDVHENSAKQKIIGSIVGLCHEMGKQVVAEGIEQRAERDALAELGCDLLQGYLFAKPRKLPLAG